jgi:hypothetical protein
MSWGHYDDSSIEEFSIQAAGLEPQLGLSDTFLAHANEVAAVSPLSGIFNYAATQFADDNITGAEANEKYGITGTPIAFKDDEMTSDVAAKIASDRYHDQVNNQAIMENVKRNYGAAASVVGFAGGLVGGMSDPINLATGIGSSMLVRSLGGMAATNLFANVAEGSLVGLASKGLNPTVEFLKRASITADTSFKSAIALELAENFAASAALDLVATPLADKAYRQETPMEQRVFNMLGSTLLGAGIGVGMRAKAIRTHRMEANAMARSAGTQADDVVSETIQHGMENVKNGVKPDMDYTLHRKELEWFNTRPGQNPYTFTPVDSANVHGRRWFFGRMKDVDLEDGVKNIDQSSSRGTTAYVVGDNYNLTNNRVSGAFDNTSGEVFEVRINKDLKIATKDLLVGKEFKRGLEVHLKSHISKLTKAKKFSRKQKETLRSMLDEAQDMDDILDGIHNFLDDYKGVPGVDDILNRSLWDMGYQGYSFVGKPNMLKDMDYNGLVIFRPEMFDATIGKNSLYVARGKQQFSVGKGYINKNVKSAISRTNERLHYNGALMEVFEPTKAEFLTKHPKNAPHMKEYYKPFVDLDTKEVNRASSITSHPDYSDVDMKELHRAKRGQENYDPANELFEQEGITKENVVELKEDPVAGKHVEALDAEGAHRSALQSFRNCVFEALGIKK